jgi:hypothetical protein
MSNTDEELVHTRLQTEALLQGQLTALFLLPPPPAILFLPPPHISDMDLSNMGEADKSKQNNQTKIVSST